MKIRFDPGVLVSTTAAQKLGDKTILQALLRHTAGDWGLVSEADKAANDAGLKNRCRLLSVYEGDEGTRFWVVTEWPHPNAPRTTVLLPEEY